MKEFFNEISQVTWISGRKLAVDTAYVLLFTVILLTYFAVVDGALGELIKNIITR